MPAVTIKFDRIGRTRNLASITVDGPTPSDVADLILREARRYLMSDIAIAFDREFLESGDEVLLIAGFRDAGRGTVAQVLGEWS